MTRPTRHKIKLIIIFGFIRLALLSAGGDNQRGLVHCTSSYIDDYFLPTAKIALNKIQQSLTPASGAELDRAAKSQLNKSFTSDDSAPRQQGQQTAGPPASGRSEEGRQVSSEPPALPEPNTNEFVKLDVRPDLEPNLVDVSPRAKSSDTAGERVVSASEASSEDAYLATESSPQSTEPIVEEAASSEPSSAVPAIESTTTSPTTSGQPPTLSADLESEQPQIDGGDNQIVGSADEAAVRETELEAIAAVEASIGFGDSFATTSDACYDEYGNARYCEPEFENVAFERQVEVSSECGHPPSRFCTTNLNERNDQIRNCHICDAQHPKKRHPAAYLTDMNNPNAPTCWVSAPISANTPFAPNATGPPADMGASAEPSGPPQPLQRDNVTLTINLDKRYELTYMSLQFCSLTPDSLAIWRSADFGKTWSPYQFYSSQCARFYERPASAGGLGGLLRLDQAEASCVNSSLQSASGRVAFSTALDEPGEGRNKQPPADKSPALQDWITATNIRIVLDRHQASWIQSNLVHAHAHHHQRNSSQGRANASSNSPQVSQAAAAANRLAEASPPNSKLPQALALSAPGAQSGQAISGAPEQLEASLTNPSDTYNYAVSDLTIGGRCKCNGHASRCVHNPDGQLQCDCQHNTDGPDCERCLPLHHDRPWQRATQTNANPCQPCNCNGHSRKCRFDPELYALSGKRSGGVCIDCKDNTTGRHCNYCREGFTRDHTKPMRDQGACKPCDCHPVGSLGKVCNHVTGQCPCKEGVTGLECNRCAPGYQQSSSPTEPCIRIPENDINYEPIIEASPEEEQQTGSVAHQSTSSGDPDQAEQPAEVSRAPVAGAPDKPAGRQQAAPKQTPDYNRIEAVIGADEPAYDQSAPSEFDHLRPLAGHRSRQRQHRPAHAQWRGYGRDYLAGAKQRLRPPPLPPFAPSDEFDELEMGRGGSQASQMRPPLSPPQDDLDDYEGAKQAYHRNAYYGKRVGVDRNGYATDYRQPMTPLRNVANLDHEQPEADQAAGLDERLAYGGAQDVPPSAIYSQSSEEANFNQIMRPRYNSVAHRYQQHRQQQQQQQQQQQRRRLTSERTQSNCLGCQAKTKKLNAKQFCNLDYAVRATVISKRASSDWTRFEVEIQDIFKSPSSSSLLPAPQKTAATVGGEPNLKSVANVQSDDPNASAAGESANRTQTSQRLSAEQAANLIPADEQPVHRLRVGSVQSVWVPTEDVACKCPRLKLHSSYLLMGLFDTRENSPAATQLDRHGVAMVWRPSLQEKLIKYQRLHSDGLCWRAAAAAA